MSRRNGFLLGVAFALAYAPGLQAALAITEPNGSGNERVAEGLEFSANVIGNRWDMSDPADVVTVESGFLADQAFIDGVFRARTVAEDGFTDPSFFLTFQGINGSVLSMDRGQMFPIDTSIYRTLTMRIRHLNVDGTPAGVKQPVIVYFFQDDRSYLDGSFGFTEFVFTPSDGDWHVIEFDLINDLNATSGYAWTDFDTVKGLRIDPTNYADIRVEVDWVRLTADGTQDTSFPVQWSGANGPFDVSARMPDGDVFILAEAVEGNNAVVDFSQLPGGDYQLEVSSAQEFALSTGVVHVNEAPILNFIQPDIEGDVSRRYSLSEAGNPWGPIDSGDVLTTAALGEVSYTNPVGSLTAVSTGGDPAVVLTTTAPIDTSHYRMLSYTLSVSGSRDIGNGSVARVFWGNNLQEGGLVTSEDIIVQEGLNRYHLGDLKDLPAEGGTTGLWEGRPFFFRLDPHEFLTPRSIRIDDVTLAPFDSARPDFLIQWRATDIDSNASVDLYADQDQVPGNGNEVLIQSGISENLADETYLWNATSQVASGVYNLYAIIDDGLNQTTRYATGPLLVGDGAPIDLTVAEPDGVDDAVMAAPEFSRLVEGNSWDMSDGGDVPFARSFDIINEQIAGGTLSGTSSGSDPSFFLLFPGATSGHVGSNGMAAPIDTTRYRYLTFKVRFTANEPQYLQIYYMTSSAIVPDNVGFTDFIEVFPGQWSVFTVDLEAATAAGSPFSWKDIDSVMGLRIDPATGPNVSWEFDWFTLTGATDGSSQYPVSWNVSNPGDSTLSLSAIDTDGVRIPLVEGVDPKIGFTSIDLARLPINDYVIDVDASPGPSWVSPGPIRLVTENIDGELANISTRAQVGTNDNVTIAGFIIRGDRPKQVVIRGRGPSLAPYIPPPAQTLEDPRLRLFNSSGALLMENEDWIRSGQYQAIAETSIAPESTLESAILATLMPGAYTAILDQADQGTGIGIVEVFDWDNGEAELINISTRARVDSGDNVTIAGFIIQGPGNRDVLIRGRGPSLIPFLPEAAVTLSNPRLRLFDKQGSNFLTNEDWIGAANAGEISSSGLAPDDEREAAILVNLAPGPYTVFLESSDGGSGIGIVEIFDQTNP